MIKSTIFRCPYLIKSDDGARCEAALCISEDNLIKNMQNADIKLCINEKRRYESCYIYFMKLRMLAISKLPIEITLFDSRHHAIGIL